jgi:hypothetical protein
MELVYQLKWIISVLPSPLSKGFRDSQELLRHPLGPRARRACCYYCHRMCWLSGPYFASLSFDHLSPTVWSTM